MLNSLGGKQRPGVLRDDLLKTLASRLPAGSGRSPKEIQNNNNNNAAQPTHTHTNTHTHTHTVSSEPELAVKDSAPLAGLNALMNGPAVLCPDKKQTLR